MHVPYGQDDVAAEEAAAELQRLRSGEAELTLHLTEKVLLSEEQHEKMVDFNLNKAIDTNKDMYWCPGKDCKFAFAYDRQANEPNGFFCPHCNKTYCLDCRVEFHNGLTCEEYNQIYNPSNEDEAFKELAKKMRFK